MTDLRSIDIAWVAGLLEGEGSFFTVRGGRKITVSMTSTDRDVLERLRRLVGGSITSRIDRPNRKPAWHWTLNRRADAAGLMMTVYPLMGERRQMAIREALQAWRSAPITRRSPSRPIYAD